ncbi:MAG: HD domain-containing protein [Nitrospinae bacterium]|nr:HD domain-containing protein [Nitrospinota bacterium]
MSIAVSLGGLMMIGWAFYYGLSGVQAEKAAPVDDLKALVALKTLSRLWREDTVRTVKMRELAKLWKKDEEEIAAEAEPEYKHELTREFYRENIKGQKVFQGNAGKVVLELLGILDGEGDCPSVVPMDITADAEAAIGRKERSTYDIFAHYTLLEHSLHVAEEARRIYGDGPDLAEAFIAALGHDIGKLPRHRDSLYAIGDHPMLSTAVLDAMPSFKALPNREEIQMAIRTHHGQGKIKEEDTFAKLFYETDKAARLREIGEFAAAKGEAVKKQEVAGRSEDKQAIVTPESMAEVKVEAQAGQEVVERPEGGKAVQPAPVLPPEVIVAKAAAAYEAGENRGDGPPKWKASKEEIKRAEIPWFRSDIFLAKIKPIINKVGPFGGKWKAISMRDGYVYVQTGYLWDAARELGTQFGDPLIRLGDGDQKVRQEILLGIVSRLREEGHIAAGLIKDGYIGGKFMLKVKTPQGQKEFSYYLTPFMAEAFAATVSQLEQEKEGNTKNVMEVAPDYSL